MVLEILDGFIVDLSEVNGGKNVGTLLASIVLPDTRPKRNVRKRFSTQQWRKTLQHLANPKLALNVDQLWHPKTNGGIQQAPPFFKQMQASDWAVNFL